MKSIVLAEKPSVGREIARVLGCNNKTKTSFESSRYIVTWAMGHLVELADPEAYDQRYRQWSLETLPMLPEKMKHRVIRRTSRQFNSIKSLLGRKDVDQVIIATDAGREGELVARWIMRLGGWKGSVKRLWISSQTDAAIRGGFGNLRSGRDYENLTQAAEGRAEADWLIGLNVTRALSCRYDTRLSAGRVQTPTLAMIARREDEIRRFQPVPFWTIQADLGSFLATWQGPKGITRLKDLQRAQDLAGRVRDKSGLIIEVMAKDHDQPPPLAYDLTALQREANASLGFSAKRTLKIMQSLYERHKILTYPRTDSRHITRDIVPTLPVRLQALARTRHGKRAQALLDAGLRPTKRLADDTKVTDHHAIIPTEEPVNTDRLNAEEKAVWDLVARRFLEVLSPPYRYRAIRVTVSIGGQELVARGREAVDPGWHAVGGGGSNDADDRDADVPEQPLKGIKKDDPVTAKRVDVRQGFTKPPPRYTEGTLLGDMEDPSRFIEDRSLRESIKPGGLGTPATRADIIEKLISSFYIERRGKELAPTPRGLELLEVVPDQLRSPELTARWEQRLARIASGEEPAAAFSRDIRDSTRELVGVVKASRVEYKPKNPGATPCPYCGRPLMEISEKGRKKQICQALSCGYQQEESRSGQSRRPSGRERAMNDRLMREYSDDSKDTATFADLIKAAQEKKKKSD